MSNELDYLISELGSAYCQILRRCNDMHNGVMEANGREMARTLHGSFSQIGSHDSLPKEIKDAIHKEMHHGEYTIGKVDREEVILNERPNNN